MEEDGDGKEKERGGTQENCGRSTSYGEKRMGKGLKESDID
jgi:hypothetical protein